ncbi:alkaline phosphatase family protein, partial [Mycobacterium tuberculosis]|uniref:alkaline phosphatase family protein n=1 Tax=Mycobacterium tuberculosis TaxID=1773 RepID=UPI001F2DC46E
MRLEVRQENTAVSQSHIGGVSRREFLAKVAAGGAGALMSFAGPVIEKAYGAGPCSGHLTDIEHFVFFMQENRSFDHYFGTLNRPGMSGDSSSWKGWGHVRWFIEEVPAG